jgi:hypothetical protein
MACDDLIKLQDQFQAYLLGKHQHILNSVVGNQVCSKEERIQVYQNAYLLRLQEALEIDYPMLAKLMGENKFDHYSQDYVLNNPSNYRSIRWFGRDFSDYLKTVQNPERLFWSELAKFEEALNTAFDAKDTESITESTLQNIPPDKWAGMTFEFHASVMMIDFTWNAPTAWKAAQQNRKAKPKKYKKSQTYLIWRHDLEPCFHKLNVGEAWALATAQQKIPFAELCEGLSTWASQDKLILYAAGLLKSWIHRGLITRLELN